MAFDPNKYKAAKDTDNSSKSSFDPTKYSKKKTNEIPELLREDSPSEFLAGPSPLPQVEQIKQEAVGEYLNEVYNEGYVSEDEISNPDENIFSTIAERKFQDNSTTPTEGGFELSWGPKGFGQEGETKEQIDNRVRAMILEEENDKITTKVKDKLLDTIPEEERTDENISKLEEKLWQEDGVLLNLNPEKDSEIGEEKGMIKSAAIAVQKGVEDVVMSTVANIQAAKEAVGIPSAIPTLGMTLPSAQRLGEMREEELDRLAKKVNQYDGDILDNALNGDFGAAFDLTLQQTGESLPLMAAASVSGSTIGALGALTGLSASKHYQDVKNEEWFKELSSPAKAGYLAAYGGSEGFDLMIGGRILKRAARSAANGSKAANKTIADFFKGYGYDVAQEGATEGATGVAQYVADMAAQGKDITFNGIEDAFVRNAVGGIGGGMVMSGTARGAGATKAVLNSPDLIKIRNRKADVEKEIQNAETPQEVQILSAEVDKIDEVKNKLAKQGRETFNKMSEEDQGKYARAVANFNVYREQIDNLPEDSPAREPAEETAKGFIDEINQINEKYNKKPVEQVAEETTEEVIDEATEPTEETVQETELLSETEQGVESEQEVQLTEKQEDGIQERETNEVLSESETQPIQEVEGEVRGERQGEEGTQEERGEVKVEEKVTPKFFKKPPNTRGVIKIDLEKVQKEKPRLYTRLKNIKNIEDITPKDFRGFMTNEYSKLYKQKARAKDQLELLSEIEDVAEDISQQNTQTKDQFKQQLEQSGDFSKEQIGVLNSLIDSLSAKFFPEYISDQDVLSISGLNQGINNFYSFSENILISKDPESFTHEVGHFAFMNVLSKNDRLKFYDYMVESSYGKSGKSLQERLAKTSETVTTEIDGKTYTWKTNVADNFDEYFAEQFSQWYLGTKAYPKEVDSLFEKVANYLGKVIDKLKSGKFIDNNLVEFFEKIVPEKQTKKDTKKNIVVNDSRVNSIVEATPKSFGKRVGEALKPLTEGRGKITNAQANTLSKRAANVDTDVKLEKFIDYATKVLTKSNYVGEVRNAKSKARSARKKYKAGKLGIDSGNTTRALSVDPENLTTEELDRYNAFLNRTTKATFEPTSPENIEDITFFSEKFEPKEKVEGGKKEIGEKAQATLDELKESYRESTKEQRVEEIDDSILEDDLNTLESLTQEELDGLTKQELESVISGINEAKRGEAMPATANAVVDKIKSNRGKDKVIDAIKGKRFSSNLRAWFNPMTYIKGKRGRMDRFKSKIRNVPLSRIDTIVKGVMDKTKPIYKTIIQPISTAYSKYEGDVRVFERDLNKLFKAIGNAKARREASIKLAMIGIAKQKAMNPKAQELASVEDYMKAIETDGTQINSYSKKADEYKKVYNEMVGDDGVFNWQDAYNNLSFAEKAAFNYVEQHFAKQAKKVQIASAKNKQGSIIYDYYNPIRVAYTAKTDASDILEQANKFATEDNVPKSPNLKNRKGSDGQLIFFEFFDNAQASTRSVLRDYYLRQPLRVSSQIINKVIDETKGDSRDFALALKDTLQEVTGNIFLNSEYDGNGFLEFLKSRGYERDLLSLPRAGVELLSNVLHGVTYARKDLATGASFLKGMNNRRLMQLAKELNTTQFSRLFQGEGTARAEVGGLGKRSVNWWDSKMKEISSQFLSKPDTLVAKPLWLGSFLNEFKNITNKDFDVDKFLEDATYRKENREALDRARDEADAKLSQGFASMNPYEGIVDAQVKRNDNPFKIADKYMTRFVRFEYQSAVDAINGMLGRNEISRTEASQLLLATAIRMTAYQAGLFTAQNLFFSLIEAGISAATGEDVGDREEESLDKFFERSQKSLLTTGLSLALLRRLGNFARIPIVLGAETLNYMYGDDLGFRDSEEYDSFEDSLLYSPAVSAIRIGADYRNWYRALLDAGASFTGPLNKLVKSTGRLIEDAYKAKTLKTPSAKKRREKAIVKDTADIITVLMGVPFGRDIVNLISREVYEDYVKKEEENKSSSDKPVSTGRNF